MVRHGADEARVDGRFVAADGDEVVLSRVIPRDGRSRAYVERPPGHGRVAGRRGDRPGRPARPARPSDRCCRRRRNGPRSTSSAASTSTRCAAARARLTEIDAELAALGGDERARAREIDLLRFQVDELDAAGIDRPRRGRRARRGGGRCSPMRVAHREAAGGGRSPRSPTTMAPATRWPRRSAALDGRRRSPSSSSASHAVARRARRRRRRGARRRRARSTTIPERLAAIRERRQLLHDLRRKYGDDLGDVMAFHARVPSGSTSSSSYDGRAARTRRASGTGARAERDRRRGGRQARPSRRSRRRSPRRSRRELARPGDAARRRSPSRSGRRDDPGDDVTFLLAANPGSPLLPLTQGRVGRRAGARDARPAARVLGRRGERARRRWCSTRSTPASAARQRPPSGEALAASAADHQVLVVTHLAQVAARAPTPRSCVAKDVAGGPRRAVGGPVDDDAAGRRARPHAVGHRPTAAAREHAAELLARASAVARPTRPTAAWTGGALPGQGDDSVVTIDRTEACPMTEAHLRDRRCGQLARQGTHGLVARAGCSSSVACGSRCRSSTRTSTSTPAR